jgi:hypothetical protein
MVVHAAIRDMEHLKSVISNPFNRAVHVLRVETSMIFNRRTQHLCRSQRSAITDERELVPTETDVLACLDCQQ